MNAKNSANVTAAARSLDELVQGIQSREDLVAFVRALRVQLQHSPEEWENRDLPSFLEALAAWVADMEGYYQNRGESIPRQPSWKVLGEMLSAAKVYE